MTYIIAVLQLLIIVTVPFLISYIKGIPKQIHDKNLELFKSELQKEVEKLKISEGNLHIRKIESYSLFTDSLNKVVESTKNKQNSKKIMEEVTASLRTFSKDIIFFASEETLKKFIDYRRYSSIAQDGGDNEKKKFNLILAELILEMRKDLGYKDENITIDDYMYILINDWDKHKEKFYEDARKAKQLSN